MAVAINITTIEAGESMVEVRGTFTLTGTYPSGGDTIPWSSAPQIPSNAGPVGIVDICEVPATAAGASGYLFWTTAANLLVIGVPTAGTGITQFSGAYGNTFANAPINFTAKFPYGVGNVTSPV